MSFMLSAVEQLFSLSHLIYLLLGVVIGLVVGIIPGLGGIAGMSLLLPFIYGMDPSVGLGMLMGLVAVVPTGDTFTSVLMGIPGSSSSQATVMDGFPLAKQGQAARALSAAFLSSLIGGVVGAIILSLFILIARPLVLSFTSSELFMLSLLGLSVVASLSGGSIFKGLTACGVGLLIGSIGGAPATGDFRFTFDIGYLYDGIPLVVVGLGIFALPEIISLLVRNKAIAQEGNKLGVGLGQGIKDVLNNLPLVGKSSVFGSLIGAIPGLGSSVVDWMTYSFAMNASKNKENFGKGEIRGVIAPESANNACACGSMVPTILFGVPGSGAAAVFLGGMLLLGIQPGVSMVSTHLDLTYVIIWSLALANIIGALLCIFFTKPVSLITYIKFSVIAPIILTLILFAAYQATRSFGDFISLGVIAFLGVAMKGANWPRPAFLIGFVLSASAENYFFQSVQFQGFESFLRPGVLVISLLILAGIFVPIISKKRFGKANQADKQAMILTKPDVYIAFTFLILASICLFTIIGQQFLTKAFPLLAIVTIILSVLTLIYKYFKQNDKNIKTEGLSNEIYLVLGYFGIATLYYFVGFLSVTLVFTFVFLRLVAKASYLKSGIIAVGLLIFLVVMSQVMNIDYPQGFVDKLFLS